MSKYDKYLSTDQPVEEEEYKPELLLDPAAIKFAQMKMTVASMNDEQIAQALNIDMKRVRKWSKNPHFIAYSQKLKEKIANEDIHETLKKQHQELLDLNYIELKRRYEDPFSPENQAILNALPDNSTKEKFLDRFAYYSPHDKLARAHNEVGKALRMMLPEGMEGINEIKIKETIHQYRNQYEDGRRKRLEREKALRKNGEKSDSPFAFKRSNQRRQEVVDAEIIEESGEVSTVEFTITRGKRNGEEEEG